jgi:hypothetical protein
VLPDPGARGVAPQQQGGLGHLNRPPG